MPVSSAPCIIDAVNSYCWVMRGYIQFLSITVDGQPGDDSQPDDGDGSSQRCVVPSEWMYDQCNVLLLYATGKWLLSGFNVAPEELIVPVRGRSLGQGQGVPPHIGCPGWWVSHPYPRYIQQWLFSFHGIHEWTKGVSRRVARSLSSSPNCGGLASNSTGSQSFLSASHAMPSIFIFNFAAIIYWISRSWNRLSRNSRCL